MTHNFEHQPAKHERAERTMQSYHHEATAQALHSDAYQHGVTGNTKDRNPFPGNHDKHLPHLHIDGHDHKDHKHHKHHKHHEHHHQHEQHKQHPDHSHTGVPSDGDHNSMKAPKSPETSLPYPKTWEQPPTNKNPYGGLQPLPNYVMPFSATPDSAPKVQPTYPGRDGSHI